MVGEESDRNVVFAPKCLERSPLDWIWTALYVRIEKLTLVSAFNVT
jgi:hypothetical protein